MRDYKGGGEGGGRKEKGKFHCLRDNIRTVWGYF